MKIYQAVILSVIVTILCGIWLENTYPHYGNCLGVFGSAMFIIGFLTLRKYD